MTTPKLDDAALREILAEEYATLGQFTEGEISTLFDQPEIDCIIAAMSRASVSSPTMRDDVIEECALAVDAMYTTAQWNFDGHQMRRHLGKTIRSLKSQQS